MLIINDVLQANPQLKHIILVRGREKERFPNLEKLIQNAKLSEDSIHELVGRRPNPMEVAHMAPTGGTTGLPKVAVRLPFKQNKLIYHGREERNLEYKRSMHWEDPATKAKIGKSAMAMANLPDGGSIIIGIEKQGEHYDPKGMEANHAEYFRQDDVMEYINEKFADPYVELKVTPVSDNEKWFVVMQVKEFNQLPVVCKNDSLEGLRRGALFTRSRVKYETASVRSDGDA